MEYLAAKIFELAVANCFTCASLLCANCVIAHQLMIAFESHSVTSLGRDDRVPRR